MEKRGNMVVDDQTITVHDSGRRVDVSLTAKVPMLFGPLFGTDAGKVTSSSSAEEFRIAASTPCPFPWFWICRTLYWNG
jgi:hypothetical protein